MTEWWRIFGDMFWLMSDIDDSEPSGTRNLWYRWYVLKMLTPVAFFEQAVALRPHCNDNFSSADGL